MKKIFAIFVLCFAVFMANAQKSAGPAPRVQKQVKKTTAQVALRSLQTEAIVAVGGTDLSHFTLGTPASVTSYGVTASEFTNSCEYFNLNYYFATSSSGQFGTINPNTGVQTIIRTGNNSGAVAYNYANNTMYGLSLGSASTLYTIDPATGVETPVVSITDAADYFMMAMTITNDGRFIVVNASRESVDELDPTTGTLTELVPAGFNVNYGQDIAVDRETNTVYWAAYNADASEGQLYAVDLAGATLNLIGAFSTQVSGFCPLNYSDTELQRPAAVSDLTATPDPNHGLSADLAWTNPTLTVGGEALTALTSVELYRDGELLHSFTNPTVGGAMSYTDNTIPADGAYNYTVYAVNAAGDGLQSTVRALVGNLCEYSIEMVDSYGDGWNGAAIEVYAGTTLMETATISSGTDATVLVALPLGECSFNWVTGSYDSECSFVIYDPFQVPVFIANAAPAAGNFLTIQNTCEAPAPFIHPDETSVSFVAIPVGATSGAKTINLLTYGLTSSITATTEAPFEVSADNVTFSTTATIAATEASEQHVLYVRFVPTEAGDVTGVVTFSADNASDTTVALNGNAVDCSGNIGTVPFTENFEGGAFPPACWTLESNNSVTWESEVSDNDQSTWAYCNYGAAGEQQDERLITKTLDLTTNLTSLALTFDFIASYYYVTNEDPEEQYNLLIYVSTDNGATFSSTPIYDMRNDQEEFENWEITSATVDLTSLIGETNVKLMFNYYGMYGAEMWIDNISIDESHVGIEEETMNTVSIYPNPATTVLNVEAEGYNTLEIVNLLGQTVYTANATGSMQINVSNLNSGVYFVRLNGANGTTTQKFIKK